MFRRAQKNKKGFTLIELIVVVAILAILAAIAVPMLIGYADQAEEAKLLANAKMIAQAINTANALEAATIVGGEGTTLDQAKAKTGELWPGGMTESEETQAFSLISWSSSSAYVAR